MEKWESESSHIKLQYSAVEDPAPDGDESLINEWHVEIVRREYESESEKVIGYGRAASFDLGRETVDWLLAADDLSADVHLCAQQIFFPRRFGLSQRTEDFIYRTSGELCLADQLLVLDHITLDPEERGRGLGPAVARSMVRRLGISNTLLAAYPQPDGWRDMDPSTLRRAKRKLEATWAGVGFRRFRAGVWLCYPAIVFGRPPLDSSS